MVRGARRVRVRTPVGHQDQPGLDQAEVGEQVQVLVRKEAYRVREESGDATRSFWASCWLVAATRCSLPTIR
jgi:hypothetical protein